MTPTPEMIHDDDGSYCEGLDKCTKLHVRHVPDHSTPDPPQTEAETLTPAQLAKVLREAATVLDEPFHRDAVAGHLLAAADTLELAQLDHQETRGTVAALKQYLTTALRERDEARRVIAELRDTLSMAHEQMSELDDLQAGQQDQITTLRAIVERLAEIHIHKNKQIELSAIVELIKQARTLAADRSPRHE